MTMQYDPAAIVRDLENGQIPSQENDGIRYAVVRMDAGRRLIVYGENPDPDLTGTATSTPDGQLLVAELTPANASVLMRHFPYTRPVSHRNHPFTLGLGDRLGVATRGHIQSVRNRGVFPVLAQQSMRELRLTGRTYEDVLADVVFAVFEEQYTDGYGADGDHLKTEEEIRYALDCGFSMITLDCSDHIDNTVPNPLDDTAIERYRSLPVSVREHYETAYLNQPVPGADALRITRDDVIRTVLIYHEAIAFARTIYHDLIRPCGRPVDFEISVDETETPTDPKALYVFANEMQIAGVDVVSLAPRFCGEFQKGIDYIGDPDRFTEELRQHAVIADRMGFKLSVHSGSDKFTVFPMVGEQTGHRVHVKTAGTSWLEALRIIATVNPTLYRRIHSFALEHVDEARAYYHVGTDIATIPALDAVPDDRLPAYLDRDDSRQALHITYGLILQAKADNGEFRFRNDIHDTLYRNGDAYDRALVTHIGRHLTGLGL